MTQVYSAGDVLVDWLGIPLNDGWAEDTFLTIEPDNDILTPSKSASGGKDTVYSRAANRGAIITMTFKDTSDTCKQIAAQAAAQSIALGADIPIAPFTVEDLNGNALFVAPNAVLLGGGTKTYAAGVSEREFRWHVAQFIETDNPEATLANISQYI